MPLKKLLKTKNYSNKFSYNDLVNAESAIGRTLFGPIPAGCQREFFISQKNVWIWYENFIDAAGLSHEMTIRYEVRPTGVFKKSPGGPYEKISGRELDNFRLAAKNYLTLVKSQLYQ